jgi:two-component system, cell cycle response regulator DivK
VETDMNARHVLLVNGDAHTRHLYRVILEHGGLRVSEAASGAAAIALLHIDSPDLIVQEIRFTAGSGLELIHAVRRSPATARIRVVVITSQVLEEQRARSAGCDAFFAKPCRPSRVLDAARRLLA